MNRLLLFVATLLTTSLGGHAEPLLSQRHLDAMTAAIRLGIHERHFPGGVLWFEHRGERFTQAMGLRAVDPAPLPMTQDTIFDAASLTKVVATTPAIMKLAERGKIDLNAPVRTYLPEFVGGGKEVITVRQLLTHVSGLRAGIPREPAWSGREAALALMAAEVVTDPPGNVFRYSDINFIALGEMAARVSGLSLDEFCRREIFEPLGMKDTSFNPPEAWRDRIAPTTREGDSVTHGVVHDPTARAMGGVAGHAGLFTTAEDLARFCRMMLGESPRVFRPDTIREMTRIQTPTGMSAKRGLGWDIDTRYSQARGERFPVGSFGHTGWTGTSIWIDPASRSFMIFLTNRNHPTERGQVNETRSRLATLAAEAIRSAPHGRKPGPQVVLNGIDVLANREFEELRGLRVGLITNHSGRNKRGDSTIDLLHKAQGVKLAALFSPEHGIRGDAETDVEDGRDTKTGLPVISLYGKIKKPTPDHLKELDALVFDIQDIGCRFYTYASTMSLAMEAAAEAKLRFFVLDRLNPINGVDVDGPMLEGEPSFTAFHDIPLRHGMTLGELALMFREDRKLDLDLRVIPVQGWRRWRYLDQTDLAWRNPSPNMRSLGAAILYPGVGLLEFMQVSVGRGTDTPFELVGAPYVDGKAMAKWMNRQRLPGLSFSEAVFIPNKSIFANQACHGVRVELKDRNKARIVDAGLAMARYLWRSHPKECDYEKFAKLLAHSQTWEAVKGKTSLAKIRAEWSEARDSFDFRRPRFFLY